MLTLLEYETHSLESLSLASLSSLLFPGPSWGGGWVGLRVSESDLEKKSQESGSLRSVTFLHLGVITLPTVVLLSLKVTSQWARESTASVYAGGQGWLWLWQLLLPDTCFEEHLFPLGIKWVLAVTVRKRKYCIVSFTFIKIALNSPGFLWVQSVPLEPGSCLRGHSIRQNDTVLGRATTEVKYT